MFYDNNTLIMNVWNRTMTSLLFSDKGHARKLKCMFSDVYFEVLNWYIIYLWPKVDNYSNIDNTDRKCTILDIILFQNTFRQYFITITNEMYNVRRLYIILSSAGYSLYFLYLLGGSAYECNKSSFIADGEIRQALWEHFRQSRALHLHFGYNKSCHH